LGVVVRRCIVQISAKLAATLQVFYSFPESLQANDGIVPQAMNTSFQILSNLSLLVILPLDVIYSRQISARGTD
jgi:hypothetical protein